MDLGYVTTSVDLVGQDLCKRHFTQLCQGYRQFCLLTYAHSGFVPKTKSWRKNHQIKTNRQTERLTNILTTISACQDFCKWHFTQLCQGYRHFCLLTYAHSGFLCQTQNLDERIVRSRRSDKQTNWQAKDKILEKKNSRQSDKKLGRNLKSRWTDELIKWHILKCFASWHEKKMVLLKKYL